MFSKEVGALEKAVLRVRPSQLSGLSANLGSYHELHPSNKRIPKGAFLLLTSQPADHQQTTEATF